MPSVWSTSTPRHPGLPTSTRLPMLLTKMSVIVALPLMALVMFVPAPLVLPIFGITAIGIAAVSALIAWWRADDRNAPNVTWWDIAGAFAFIGFAAVLLSQPEDVLPLLDR